MAFEDTATIEPGHESVAEILANRSFVSVFQPIVDIATGLVVGYEALSRFAGRAPADVFAEARADGLALDLELVTMRAALVAARRLPGARWLDINVSGLALQDARLHSAIAIADRRIVLELRAEDLPGLGPSITDVVRAFGDHASLAIVVGHADIQLPVGLHPDLVKLDRALTAQATAVTDATWLTALAAQARLNLVAEGVETGDQARALLGLGVELGQGNHFGPPAPATVRPSAVN